MYVCMCACVRACVRVCACVRACMHHQNVVETQDRMKSMCGGGGSKFGDTRGCLVLLMVLLAALSAIIILSIVKKFT